MSAHRGNVESTSYSRHIVSRPLIMRTQVQIYIYAIALFVGLHCKDETLPPCTDCPQPVDTTSHDFTFFVDTLGDGSSSVLYDVAIVNDSLIYSVGEIYRKDSTGEFENQGYNFVTWNGKIQNIQKLLYDYQGQKYFEPLNTIYTIKSEIIWVAGTQPRCWDGNNWQQYNITSSVFNGRANAILRLNNSLYLVGTSGAIVFYNGSNWIPISTGTMLDFKDIWGDKNPVTGEYEIYAVASKGPFSTEGKIFRIQGTTAAEISTDGIPYSTSCIWFKSQKQYYVAGGGMWRKENITSNTPWQSFENGVTPYYIYGMRGQSENDIVAVGSFGELLHYNGKSWKSFRGLPGFNNLELYSVDIKGNVLCAVGYIGNRACVVRGYRR